MSLAKNFEDNVKEQLESWKTAHIIRMYDVTNGFKNVDNPCDFIVYHYPNMLMLELKSTHQNTLNFASGIRENQWKGLEIASKVNGIIAGVMVWFVEKDITSFVKIQDLIKLRDSGKKSLSSQEALEVGLEIKGKKKRIYYDYDFTELLRGV